MNRIQRILLELLRSGLSGQVPSTADFPLTHEEWKQLFFESLKQTVQGVVFDGIQRLPSEVLPPADILSQWEYATHEIEFRYQQHLRLISYLTIRYEVESGLSPVILKGLGLAAYYPCPQHRYAGDIDMYFGGREASEKIDQLVKSWGVKVEGGDDVETVFMLSGVVLENHKELIDSSNPFVSKRSRSDLEQKIQSGTLFQQVHVEKTPMKVLTPLYHHLLLLTHSLKHVLNSGIGFRQLCDVAMLLKAEKANIDSATLRQLLREWGIYRWACLVYSFCVNHLGTPKEELPFMFDISRYDSDILLQEVWKSGNFGQMDERMAQRAPGGDSVFTAKRIFGNAWRFFPYAPGDAIGLPFETAIGSLKKKFKRK